MNYQQEIDKFKFMINKMNLSYATMFCILGDLMKEEQKQGHGQEFELMCQGWNATFKQEPKHEQSKA